MGLTHSNANYEENITYAEKWDYKPKTAVCHKAVEEENIDVVEICVPNNLHAEKTMNVTKAAVGSCDLLIFGL